MLLIGFFTVTPLLFVYLFTVKAIKELNAEKNLISSVLKEKENQLEQKRVEIQKLTSEDEIVRKAENKFGFERIDFAEELIVNESRIKRVEKIINEKYD